MQNIVFIHFFPFPFLFCFLILTLICINNRHHGAGHLVRILLFGLYIIEVIRLLFFPLYLQDNWLANLNLEKMREILKGVNLSPFYFLSITDQPFSLRWLFLDFGRNLLLTIPFGVGIAYFRKPGWVEILLWSLCTGLFLEGAQLLLKMFFNNYHVVDINDVILNGLGVFTGYLCYLFIRTMTARKTKTITNTVSYH